MKMIGQLHCLAALPPRIMYQYPFSRRLGGPQSRSRRFGENTSILHVQGKEPRLLGRPARGLVAALTGIPTSPLNSCTF
jgi:hypothetical protein